MRAIVTHAAVNPAAAATIDLSLFQHRRRHRQLGGSPSSSPHLSAPGSPRIVIAAVHVRALNVSLMVRRDLDRIYFHRAFKQSINSAASIDVRRIEIREYIDRKKARFTPDVDHGRQIPIHEKMIRDHLFISPRASTEKGERIGNLRNPA